MKILESCKRVLSIGGLGNDKYTYIGGKRIPRAFSPVFIITAQLIFGVSAVKICIDNYAIDLQAMLFGLHCVILYTMKIISYGVLVSKTEQIHDLVEYIQMVVNERAFSKIKLLFS